MSDSEPMRPGYPPTAAVDEALKERAMDEAPVGITISDPSLPDNPLVYVNDAYERLTGYSREEVLGRNCRLLQGPETREAPVAEMARAVAAEERTSVELRNYRKDGTEFWNRVDIAPVHEDGELTNFVGFQTDVTRRVLAERAARERARGLRDERERLRRVLDRVNGLVGDVTEGVAAAASRMALQRAVCRAVGGVDPFAFALVGEYDPASGDVVPAVGSAGGDTEVSAFDLSFEGDDPVARAVESGRVEGVNAEADGGLHGGDWPNCYESMAAVPLAYRESTYGALCVYATTADAFDDTEREVLGAIGRVVATGINAVESRRRVATDESERLTFEVADASFVPVALAAALGERVEYVGAEQADDGLTQLFDADAAADASAVDERVAAVDGVARATEVATHDDGTLLAVETAAQSLVDALAARGVAVVAVEATPAAARVVVDAPGDVDPRSVADVVDTHCGDASLTAVRQQSAVEDDDAVERALTDRQRAVLRRAHAAGYFERTRSVSGEQLASSMGLSPSTFHEHLRAALRKVVAAATSAERLDVDAT